MNNQTQQQIPLTYEAMMAFIYENERFLTEQLAETRQFFREKTAERERERKERERERKEKERERERERKELDKRFKETEKLIKEISKSVGGMGNSNGEMAEEYFYNAFKADTSFANEKFDIINKNTKISNNELEAEYDLLLFNGKSAAIIEVKYNAKPENIKVERIISRVETFKKLMPAYKDFNIYLGVAAMAFKEGLEAELHQAGIATIRPVGKKMVKFDKDVKVF